MVWFVVVHDAAILANVVHVLICTVYPDKPAPASVDPLRDSAMVPLTATPLIGAISVGVLGAVVSKMICLATLYGFSVPAVNNAVRFLAPSPGVRFIACSVYGYGAMSGTPMIFGLIFPLIATVLAIFANSAA